MPHTSRHLLRTALRQVGIRRARLASIRMCCERNALSVLPSGPRADRPRILCYHSVGTPSWGVNDVAPGRFRRQIETALAAGYRFVDAEKLAAADGAGNELAITFDDGLKSVLINAAPILAEYRIPWTLFVVTEWSDGRHDFEPGIFLDWDDVLAAARAGATIGSHSVSHPNFGELDDDTAQHELFESRRIIRARTGIDTTSFAIPFGQSHNWSGAASRFAKQAGYQTVYAQSEERRPIGTIPRTFVTTFDNNRLFQAALRGSFDRWEEWM